MSQAPAPAEDLETVCAELRRATSPISCAALVHRLGWDSVRVSLAVMALWAEGRADVDAGGLWKEVDGMNEQSGPVNNEPQNDVQTALDIGLEAAARVLKSRLGASNVDLVIIARMTGPNVGAGNDGYDSGIAAFLESDGLDAAIIRGMLERALREELDA